MKPPAALPLLLLAAPALAQYSGPGADPAPAPNPPHPRAPDARRFLTSRADALELALPGEQPAFTFAVFGDRTGGPADGVTVLARAVEEVNLIEPDLVMTVGDLINGYNQTPEWMAQMEEFKRIMDALVCPWFPVAGNHDVYWRGPEGERPDGEHEGSYEAHFGPLWYALRHKNAWFVVLYSDEGDPATGKKTFNEPAAQRMSAEQFTWLEETLQRTRSAEHVFVFLHHPRWLGGGYGDDWERVHSLLAEQGNVDAVFAGHIHRMRYDGTTDGIEYFTLATVGGGQGGAVPEAGYLHQYTLVTVRDGRVAVASYPVGSAFDPRTITGTVSEEALAVSRALGPRFVRVPRLEADLGTRDVIEVELANPSGRPIAYELTPASGDPRWLFAPAHHSGTLEAGAKRTLTFRAGRLAHPALEFLELPELTVVADYLAEERRFHIPARAHLVPVDPGALPAPPRPEGERALAVDGSDDHLSVPSAELELPDGPLTLEAWMNADALDGRRGLVTKTEGSEFGLFVSDGVPQFIVHLGGAYVDASASDGPLATGAWHHVAGVWDGSEVRLYVDGTRVASAPGAGGRNTNELPLLVGADVGGAGEATSPFAGRIDEVRLSRVARYAGASFTPVRRLAPDADTALLLHMDGDAGPWVYDSSPAAAHPRRAGGARVVAVE